MFDDVKLSLRLTTDAFDNEVEALIFAAKADMVRVGIDRSIVEDEEDINPLVRHAVMCYCKAHFGFDNEMAEFFDRSYRQIVCDLMNSEYNIAAISQREAEEESE